jgi:hypothetical protein
MLRTLLESGKRSVERRTPWTVASVLAHAMLIATAVGLTTRDGVARIERPHPEPVVYVAPPPAPKRPRASQERLIVPLGHGPFSIPVPSVPRIDAFSAAPIAPQLRFDPSESSESRIGSAAPPSGKVQPATITVIQATHALFGDAVRHWLLKTRYVPAEFSGRSVSQLVEQRVAFTLRR